MTRARGFTLVELLVTAALVSLVAGTVLAVFAGGIRVWERSNAAAAETEHVRLALESIRRDLHNACLFAKIPFEGEYDRFSFPSLVERVFDDGTSVSEVGRAGYHLKAGQGLLCRSAVPYRKARSVGLAERCKTVASGIERIRFSYYVPEPGTKESEWTGSISSEKPPLAVKIEIGYRDAARKRAQQTLVVWLPLASLEEEEES